MNILSPSRIHSLGAYSLRIFEHGAEESEWDISVYPFETIEQIKLRIAHHHTNNSSWLPSHLFIAVKKDEEVRPIEFQWPFTTTLPPPLEQQGIADSRLVEGNVRKIISPTFYSHVTLEFASLPTELHVWRLKDLAEGIDITDAVLGGYIQLYFPLIKKQSDILSATKESADDSERKKFLGMETYLKIHDTQLHTIDTLIPSLTSSSQLSLLRTAVFSLPYLPIQNSLEILFYEIQPTFHCPFVRFFPQDPKSSPLLKLASGSSGIPYISDIKLLRQLLSDLPDTDKGPVLLCKSLIAHPQAPEGTAWTLRIQQSGQATVEIHAPRKDAPIPGAVIAKAFQELEAFLEVTPWKGQAINIVLHTIAGVYEFILQKQTSKPSLTELRTRTSSFAPLCSLEKSMKGESATLSLRWKAVPNFSMENSDVLSHITQLFLKTASCGFDTVPPTFIQSLSKEFDLTPDDARDVVKLWLENRDERIAPNSDAPEQTVRSRSTGSMVGLFNGHPKYLIQVACVESMLDLERILTCMAVLFSHTSKELKSGDNVVTEAVILPIEPEPQAENIGADIDIDAMMMDAAMMMYNDVQENIQNASIVPLKEAVSETKATLLEVPKDIRMPSPLKADEPPMKPIADGFFLEKLYAHDTPLFKYKSQKQSFAVKCQNSANRQPNVMSADAYRRIRALYGSRVHWLESPLSEYDTMALTLADSTRGEREGFAKKNKIPTKDVIEYEKRALRLGIPLKRNESVMRQPDDELKELIAFQESKPLWIVARAGSQIKSPNYYICAEFWCVRDDLPIPNDDFLKDKSCPFCGGREIKNTKKPTAGETILRRETVTKTGESVAKYAGFLAGIFHPNGYAVPCCFTNLKNMTPPQGTQPLPDPLVELPDTQQIQESTEPESNNTTEEETVVGTTVAQKHMLYIFLDTRVKMPYKPARFEKLTKGTFKIHEKDNKIEFTAKRILRAYILESTQFPLEYGKVGLVPPALDTFLSQDRKKYLESQKHGDIYTHPEVTAAAFFRLGLGVGTYESGRSLHLLATYLKYCVSSLWFPTGIPPIHENLLESMFEAQEHAAFHAFQQANNGTLIHEFADPESTLSETEFQKWCGKMDLSMGEQRPFNEHCYHSWKNFEKYVKDDTERKDWRIWEQLFAARGLFSATGVILVRITLDENGYPKVVCPSFGITQYSQMILQPIVLLYEDRKTQLFEPLVLFQGPDKLLGALSPLSPVFSKLPKPLHAALSKFYASYMSASDGCGRSLPVPNPWVLEKSQHNMIPLSYLLVPETLQSSGLEPAYLVRDRTGRLVGICMRTKGVSTSIFIPVIDDGYIDISLPCKYDVDALNPKPNLQTLLTVLMGSSAKDAHKGLAVMFKGLIPNELIIHNTRIVGIECRNGSFIPIQPMDILESVSHIFFPTLKKRGYVVVDRLPWEEDLQLLLPSEMTRNQKEATHTLEFNPEESFNDIYAHLRLSLAHWLNTTSQGEVVKTKLLELRGKRTQLPLFELRKRADLLLFPHIQQWIHVDETTGQGQSILRRNCLQIKKESDCAGACSWSDGRCLIHATQTAKYIDPAYILTARVVDELLRTHMDAMQVLDNRVSRLHVPKGVLRGKSDITLAVEGKGEDAIFQELGLRGRLPSRYSASKTYAEELSQEDVGFEESWYGIPADWMEKVRYPPLISALSRDPRARREHFWGLTLKKEWPEIKHLFIPRIQYQDLANMTGSHFLLTEFTGQIFEIARWIAPSKDSKDTRTFFLFDPEFTPLMKKEVRSVQFLETDLPAEIQKWLESHFPEGYSE